MDLWISKYKPRTIKTFYGNHEHIIKLTNWLLAFEKQKNKSIIIFGNKGLGKTTAVKLVLKELGYTTKIIFPNDIKILRNINFFNDYINNDTIYNQLNAKASAKIALIFLELENISLTNERKYIMDIYKENNKLKAYPFIFISNNIHSKLLYELKKNCTEVYFKNLSIDTYHQIVNNILLNENITIESKELVTDIIMLAQNDIRKLINILQELSFHITSDRIISQNIFNNFILTTREKNINVSLFTATETILNSYLMYDNILTLYETEKVLLPLMIHENYIKKIITKHSTSYINNLNIIQEISDLLSIGDNIETRIYTEQNWFLQTIHGFYTCVCTSYLINKINIKKIKLHNIKFSIYLNKKSLKNINRKNIN